MNSTGVAGGFFQGVLDEARIWSVARAQADVESTMGQELTSGVGLVGRWGLNEGTGTTAGDSVGGTNGTLTNGPAWVVGYPLAAPPAGPHALQFDGTNDHVTFGQATTRSARRSSRSRHGSAGPARASGRIPGTAASRAPSR